MDSMNFLNKKYTSVHTINSLAHSRNRSSKVFIPSTHFTPTALGHSQHNSHVTAIPVSSNISTQLASNHCTIHPHQLIRHLCLDCIELLCSECISDHISVHKQNNSFPNIQTLKQVKTDMNVKLQEITGYMFKEKNHPKNMANTVDAIRKDSNDKIQNLRKDLIDFVDQWISRLRASIMNNIGYEQIRLIQQEMYSLHEQVNQLINSLGSSTVSVHDIKKAYQIDADRLLKCYKQMMDKYTTLSDTMRVDVDLDSSKFIEGLQQSIALKIGGKNKTQIIKVDENQQSQIIENEAEQVIAPPTQQPTSFINNFPKNSESSECIPLMYNIVSGTDTIRIVDPSNKAEAKSYKLEGLQSYPLNSSALLPDGMVVISGGMIAENKKSDIVQVFDYEEGKLVTQSKMKKGRSSHRTIVNGQQIFLIGGFSSENQECRDVEIVTVNGVQVSPHKCKWGGPNLCIKTKTNQILKITVSGIESMSLQTLQWKQITNEVPFALSKGMQIASYLGKDNTQIVTIFGDDEYFYQWDLNSKKIIKRESNLSRPVINATTYNNCIYGWVQDIKITLYKLEQENWHITSFK